MTENYLHPSSEDILETAPPGKFSEKSPEKFSGKAPDKVPEKFKDPQTGEIRVEALMTSYLEMEKKLSRMMPYPDSPHNKDKVYQHLGRPKSPEAYSIDLSHGMFGRDKDCDHAMYEKGFSNDQAQLVYDLAREKMAPMIMEMAAEFQADREIERLVDKFGGPERWREMSRQLLAYGKKSLSPDALEGLSSSYDGVMALYKMMQRDEPGINARTDGYYSQESEDELRSMVRDPRYWRDKDPSYIRKVSDGFRKLYGE